MCRQLASDDGVNLEYESHTTVASGMEGIGVIHLDDMACVGDEMRLHDCPHNGRGAHNCGAAEDTSVTCKQHFKNGTIRFVDGYNEYNGRPEIYNNDTEKWNTMTVCDDSFGKAEGNQ